MGDINCKHNVAHYTSYKNIKKIFSSKKLKLSKVANFDDPRESTISWLETIYIGSTYKLIDLEQLKKSISKKINILCCCAHREYESSANKLEQTPYSRPRMWSQYGDQSQGLCLILDKQEITKQILLHAKQPEKFMHGHIDYKDWLHLIHGSVTLEITDNSTINEIDLFSKINENEMLKYIYFNKTIDWKDESEYRWLLFENSENDVYINLTPCLKGLVLGVNFPFNKIKPIKKYCLELKCPCYKLDYSFPEYRLCELSLQSR